MVCVINYNYKIRYTDTILNKIIALTQQFYLFLKIQKNIYFILPIYWTSNYM